MNTSFLIAAPTSGSGKTTIARGLMALCTRKGLRVQPFKCGPDYIDTMFHTAVCGRPSVNLDTFMASHAHVRELYNYYAQEADICIVEGMMGLFDGYNRDRGSAAEIANILRLPIVLVVDARSAAYSMAALLKGFIHFRTDLQFAGVIFNRVGSQRHAQMLRDVAAEVGVTCLGCVPKTPALEQGSRYLGLDFSKTTTADELLDVLEQNLELRDLIDFPTHGKTVSHAWETHTHHVSWPATPSRSRFCIRRRWTASHAKEKWSFSTPKHRLKKFCSASQLPWTAQRASRCSTYQAVIQRNTLQHSRQRLRCDKLFATMPSVADTSWQNAVG